MMKMRIPAIPLFTVDPYFSVWSYDTLNDRMPMHWTGTSNAMVGTVTVDGTPYRFLGTSADEKIPQVSLDMDALTTTAVFQNDKIRLTAAFTSPMLAEDLYLSSRPVTYLKLTADSVDGKKHAVSVKLSCSEELVLNRAGEGRAWSQSEDFAGLTTVRMGNGTQNVLWRSGDGVRIDWGYLYLAVRGDATVGNEVYDGKYAIWAQTELTDGALFLLGYDDIKSIQYFGENLDAYWKKDGKTIGAAMSEAAAEYESLRARCDAFAARMRTEALAKGNEEYAELLTLAYRQVMAAHKLVLAPDGKVLYISKECFSNGCGATVDVTYPSAPMYLYYNTELLKGMLRPVFAFASGEEWTYDFAPHDVGQYPLLNRQVYGIKTETEQDGLWTRTKYAFKPEMQMPVEECGNMIVLVAALCERDGDYGFAREYLSLLKQWKDYLIRYGEDPENQLCTDDFAGHLAHNCNLSLKAIFGIVGYARIMRALGDTAEADELTEKARAYAQSFLKRAANDDGSYRLAYDRPGTFSLKYNAVWDKVWKTGVLPDSFFAGEIARYKKEAHAYGVPLDSREQYTKSDWELWVACMADDPADFAFITARVWNAYHTTRRRVPMTDWYYADTAEWRGFQHRTVQGGLFLRLLMD